MNTNIRSIDNSIKRCGNCLYCAEDWNYEGCWVCTHPSYQVSVGTERDCVCDEWADKSSRRVDAKNA